MSSIRIETQSGFMYKHPQSFASSDLIVVAVLLSSKVDAEIKKYLPLAFRLCFAISMR